MDLLEYQGKSLFARIGVPVPDGRVATTPTEAQRAAEEIGGRVVVNGLARMLKTSIRFQPSMSSSW